MLVLWVLVTKFFMFRYWVWMWSLIRVSKIFGVLLRKFSWTVFKSLLMLMVWLCFKRVIIIWCQWDVWWFMVFYIMMFKKGGWSNWLKFVWDYICIFCFNLLDMMNYNKSVLVFNFSYLFEYMGMLN